MFVHLGVNQAIFKYSLIEGFEPSVTALTEILRLSAYYYAIKSVLKFFIEITIVHFGQTR